jgi:hypothetical protein
MVAQRIVGRRVVVVPSRLREMRGQLDVRVAIGRGGEVEGVVSGRRPRRRQRGCGQDEHQDQEGAACETMLPGSFSAPINPAGRRTWMELLFLSFAVLSGVGLSDIRRKARLLSPRLTPQPPGRLRPP